MKTKRELRTPKRRDAYKARLRLASRRRVGTWTLHDWVGSMIGLGACFGVPLGQGTQWEAARSAMPGRAAWHAHLITSGGVVYQLGRLRAVGGRCSERLHVRDVEDLRTEACHRVRDVRGRGQDSAEYGKKRQRRGLRRGVARSVVRFAVGGYALRASRPPGPDAREALVHDHVLGGPPGASTA